MLRLQKRQKLLRLQKRQKLLLGKKPRRLRQLEKKLPVREELPDVQTRPLKEQLELIMGKQLKKRAMSPKPLTSHEKVLQEVEPELLVKIQCP